MACYFWILLDDKFPLQPPGPPCESCGSIIPEPFGWNMDMGCPNCHAGALTEADILAIQYEQEIYDSISPKDWEDAEVAHYFPDICSKCNGRYNASNHGLYSGLCQKCEDADLLEQSYRADAEDRNEEKGPVRAF